jgi:hypothetical protein
VTDIYWNVVAWNEPATRLFGDFEAIPPEARNILDLLFLNPDWRALFADWDDIAKAAIAQFRAQTARLHDDPACRARVARLTEAPNSPNGGHIRTFAPRQRGARSSIIRSSGAWFSTTLLCVRTPPTAMCSSSSIRPRTMRPRA